MARVGSYEHVPPCIGMVHAGSARAAKAQYKLASTCTVGAASSGIVPIAFSPALLSTERTLEDGLSGLEDGQSSVVQVSARAHVSAHGGSWVVRGPSGRSRGNTAYCGHTSLHRRANRERYLQGLVCGRACSAAATSGSNLYRALQSLALRAETWSGGGGQTTDMSRLDTLVTRCQSCLLER
ncbi:hypothetical protein ACSS6W_006379 [Trichoderma asperelloides]